MRLDYRASYSGRTAPRARMQARAADGQGEEGQPEAAQLLRGQPHQHGGAARAGALPQREARRRGAQAQGLVRAPRVLSFE